MEDEPLITTQGALQQAKKLENERILAILNKGMAGNVPALDTLGKGAAEIAQNIYKNIKNFTQHGYKPGNLDEEGVVNSAKVTQDLFGMGALSNTASGVLSALGGGAAKAKWTPEMQNTLKQLSEKYPKGTPGGPDAIARDFKAAHPHYQGSDVTIKGQVNRVRLYGGVNVAGGAPSVAKVELVPSKTNPAGGVNWDERMFSTLKNLDARFGGVQGGGKRILHEFRGRHPEFNGSDATIRSYQYRMRGGWKPFSEEGGGSTLGVFGGKSITPSKSPEEIVQSLEKHKPVDRRWVENWLERAGVNYTTKVKGKQQTAYIEPNPVNPPMQRSHQPIVRVPRDEHMGHPPKNPEIGNKVDTGIAPPLQSTMDHPGQMNPARRFWSRPGQKGGHLAPLSAPSEHSLINQSNMSYAHPEAMDAFLKYRLSTAPDKGNWLIPPNMAPKQLPPRPEMPQSKIPTDPRQSEMNFGPEDILKALQGRY